MFRKTVITALTIAIVTGATFTAPTAASAKDGRNAAAIIGALAGISSVLLAMPHDGGPRHGYRPGRGYRDHGFGGHQRPDRFDGARIGGGKHRDHGFQHERRQRTRIGEAACFPANMC